MRKIIHIDMDCFYAAVEVKMRPDLKGQPLGVGYPPESRGVLTTASYEARKFGVKSAMSTATAMRLCPQLILVPPHFEIYRAESHKIREIFQRFTPLMEPLSLDEAYLDVTECRQFGGSATLIAREIRRLIFEERKLTASAGIAPNKFLAKIASDWNKPNGQFVVSPQDVDSFVKTLPVTKIFGVGKVTAKKMHSLGLITCEDLQKQSLAQLEAWFGSWAQDLADYARGIDHRPVEVHQERKSLTVEETYSTDLLTVEECLKKVPGLYRDFAERLEASEEQGRISGIVVKLKYFDFKSTTHERGFTGVPQENDFRELLVETFARRGDRVRLIGLGVRLGSTESRKPRNSSQLSFAMEESPPLHSETPPGSKNNF